MATVLLKNVVATNPAPVTINVQQSASSNTMWPSQTVLPLLDSLGNSIDATAGTISSVQTMKQQLNGQSIPVRVIGTGAAFGGFTIDLSVIGQIKLTVPFSASGSVPAGSYPFWIESTDSAGGSTQLMARGTVVFNNNG